MKKYLAVLLVAMAMSLAAFANSTVDFSSQGGTLTGGSAGLTLNSDAVTTGGILGTVQVTTGTLSTGNVQMGGTFTGGTLSIAGVFSGAFTGPVQWALMTLANGTHQYSLSGDFSGTWYGNSPATGVMQLNINTGKGFFNGYTTLSGGSYTISTTGVVPEPATLLLYGTGLVAIGWSAKRRYSKNQKEQ